MFDHLLLPGFLAASDREEILGAMRAAAGAPATVYGTSGAVEPRMRRVTRVEIDDDVRERIINRLMDAKPAIAAHFGLEPGDVEAPQFLRYENGDFFVAHQDGNTPMIRSSGPSRRISLVVFLSERHDYDGGALIFHGPYTAPNVRLPIIADAGTLVAFRSETTHEVTPVTRGERFTIVSWYA